MVKRLTAIFIAIVLIVVILALALIVPGQIQIRDQKINIPDFKQIKQRLDAVPESDRPVKIQFINTSTQETPYGLLGHLGVLITWSDGKQFLIDTGMTREVAQKFSKNLELIGAKPSQNFGPIDEQLGPYVDFIKGVALTHLHIDHSSGITGLCYAIHDRGKEAIIFQTQTQATIHNMFTKEGQSLIDHSVCQKQGLGHELIKSIPGFDGLLAIEAGGHTPGSTIYITQFDGRVWVFAGDITNQMSDIHDNKGKGFIYSYLLVPENTKLLARWRLWLRKLEDRNDVTVLVAHDIKAFEQSGLKKWKEPE